MINKLLALKCKYVFINQNTILSNLDNIVQFNEREIAQPYIKIEERVTLYLIFDSEREKSLLDEEKIRADMKSIPMLPLGMLRTYAMNFAHDFRNYINSISSVVSLISNTSMGIVINENIEEARASVRSNLALVGLGKITTSKSLELLEQIEKMIKRYFCISFKLESKILKEEVPLNLDIFFAAITLSFQKFFPLQSKKESKIYLEIDKSVKVTFTINEELNQYYSELIMLDNKTPMHGLGFLRMICDRIYLEDGKEKKVYLEWDLKEEER